MDKLYYFAIILCTAAVGYLLKATKVLKKEDAGPLSKLILNVTLPAVVFRSFLSFQFQPMYLLFSGAVILYQLMLFGLSFIGKKYRGNTVYHISFLGMNLGLFIYPIIQMLYGAEGMSIIVFADFGNAFMIFALSYGFCVRHQHLEKNSSDSEGRQITRPSGGNRERKLAWIIIRKILTFFPMLSYLAAIGFSSTGLSLPGLIIEILDILASANIALVLIVLGLSFDISITKEELKMILKVSAIRFLIGSAFGITLYYLLPLNELFRRIIIICAVLPVALSVIPYSIEFKLNTRYASGLINITNIISMILIILVTSLL